MIRPVDIKQLLERAGLDRSVFMTSPTLQPPGAAMASADQTQAPGSTLTSRTTAAQPEAKPASQAPGLSSAQAPKPSSSASASGLSTISGKCISGDCTGGFGVAEYDSGDRYEGQWRGGRANGSGTYLWKDGDRYVGSFQSGQPDGVGAKYFINGDRYEGEWKSGRYHGQGKYYWRGGSRYEGEFKEGRFEGQGKKYYPNGDHYEGQFQQGQFHGYGAYYWSTGDRYVGRFDKGNFDGLGAKLYADGLVEQGVWQNDRLVTQQAVDVQQLMALASRSGETGSPAIAPTPPATTAASPQTASLQPGGTSGARLPPMITASRRIALVIGNADYATAPLKNPINDANDMAEVLQRLGFTVSKKLNVDRRDMREAIRDFGDRILRGEAIGLFYYAGHGIQVKGENYLVPIGADVQREDEVDDECLPASFVLGKMETAGNSLNIIILDACRNNPFPAAARNADRGLARMDAPTGSILAYATAPGASASEGDGRNGLYTSRLLVHMRTPGLRLEDVFINVRNDVRKLSSGAQVPWETHSLGGRFYFLPPK